MSQYGREGKEERSVLRMEESSYGETIENIKKQQSIIDFQIGVNTAMLSEKSKGIKENDQRK